MDDDLYQALILDHARRPRGAGVPAGGGRAALDNPFCGDAVTVGVRIVDGRIAEVGFEGEGCALAKASASMMTEAVRGKRRDEVLALAARFEALLAGGPADGLGDLAAFTGVAHYPIRRKCATLAWEALRRAMTDET